MCNTHYSFLGAQIRLRQCFSFVILILWHYLLQVVTDVGAFLQVILNEIHRVMASSFYVDYDISVYDLNDYRLR